MGKPVIEFNRVSYRYQDGTKALKDVRLQIPLGKKVAFLGPNGSGKSTLLLQMNGILKPTGGEILYQGQPLSYKKKDLLNLRKEVSIVFQDPEVQLFSASVYQEISFGPRNFGKSLQEVKEVVEETLDKTGLVHLKDKAPQFLSYGQKKLVSIAGILAVDPEVIILDEPTAWLDPGHRGKVMGLLEELNDQKKTLIISTHDVDLAYSWADYIFIMDQGRLMAQGKTREIFKKKEILKKANLEIPWIVDVYDSINKILEIDDPPRDKEELFEYLGQLNEEVQ